MKGEHGDEIGMEKWKEFKKRKKKRILLKNDGKENNERNK